MNTQKLVDYLVKLRSNNNKEWFTKNKSTYENLRNEFTNLVFDLIQNIQSFDTDVKFLDPKKCLFRINRDIRFSKDKSPYKTQFSAQFTNMPKGLGNIAYYFHIDADGNLLIAGGMYAPDKKDLEKVRQNIVQNPEEIEDVIFTKDFEKHFKEFDQDLKLTRIPRGYSEDSLHANLLKFKSFTVSKMFKIEDLKDKEIEKKITEYFKMMLPMMKWLRSVIL